MTRDTSLSDRQYYFSRFIKSWDGVVVGGGGEGGAPLGELENELITLDCMNKEHTINPTIPSENQCQSLDMFIFSCIYIYV